MKLSYTILIITLIITVSSIYYNNNVNGIETTQNNDKECITYYIAVHGLTKLMKCHTIDEIISKINSICSKYDKHEIVMCDDTVISYMRFMMELIDEYDVENMKCYVSDSYENDLYKWISINTLILEKIFD